MPQIFQTRVIEIEDFPAAKLRRLIVTGQPGHTLPEYHAGQYAMLTFDGFPPRPYSIGNAPGADHLEFHIRNTGNGASQYASEILRIDDSIEVTAPFGSCLYIADCERPLVAVAGGSGLAGMKAIIEEALSDPRRTAPVSLYCGARALKDLYLDDQFRTLEETDSRFHYLPVLSEEQRDGFSHGLVATVMADDLADLSGHRLYGAGPVEMLRHFEREALAHGAVAEYLHTDLHQHS